MMPRVPDLDGDIICLIAGLRPQPIWVCPDDLTVSYGRQRPACPVCGQRMVRLVEARHP